MRARSLLTLCTSFLLIACFGEEADVAERLDEKDVRQVLEEAAEQHYDPPDDGKLTREQIDMYLSVREREREIARVARQRIEDGASKLKESEASFSGVLDGIRSLGSAADFLTADIRAAQELGYNTAEYEWVKERVLEAASSVLKERVAASSRSAIDRRAEQLREKMEQTDNETERNTYARLLQAYEKVAESDQEMDESVAYNRELLSEYESALDTIGIELSKWELREGQAAAKIEELDRKLEAVERGEEAESR